VEPLLDFVRGPLLRFSVAVLVLGLARNVILLIWGVLRAYRMTDDKNVSWRKAARETLDWLVPVRHVGHRSWLSVLSIVFHVGVIVVPVFLLAHVRLIHANIGLRWPALPMTVADLLTLLTIATVFALVVTRVVQRPARGLSRPQEYVIPLLLAVPFISGFLATHHQLNPFAYDPTLLVHMLSAELLFVIAPFTKLAHMALMPLARAPSELAWRFPPDYPEAVARDIGTGEQPI
jgi:nitrate reductase gamma subunit